MLEPKDLSILTTPEPDLSRLPVDFYPGPTPFFGVILMLAGVLGPIAVGGVLGLVWLVSADGESWGWLVPVFAAIPLLALPWGWWVIRSRTILRIGAEQVEYLRVTPLRRTSWQAPLAQFTAVAYRKVLPPSRSTGENTLHGVELIHRGGERDIRLMQSTEEALARLVQSQLAKLTGLPAEERDPVRR